MNNHKIISVVIGIKDWEPARLELAILSHLNSSIGKYVEIVVSDYGSADPTPIRTICEKHQCIYQYTQADIWSRSRALNVGIGLCSTDVFLTTDADIIFAPDTIETAFNFLTAEPNSLVLCQCEDLAEDYTIDKVGQFNWPEIYSNSRNRPRWGMGGLCAFSRDTYDSIRGFEERMTIWGGEDNDFVKRCRQAGRFLHWITGPDVGIYHVWHPPFLQTNPNANEVFSRNKSILNEDTTTTRNYIGEVYYKPKRPLVSINVAMYNRGHLIGDVITSILNQSVQDFELLLYDDGSTDNTADVVSSFNDSRIRFLDSRANCGVAHARNVMVQESKGQYICVHDDDDIMLPNRLELQLLAMSNEVAGTYGGWVDYDADTGELSKQTGKEPFGIPSTAFVGSVLLHPTLMIKTDVMKRINYETSFVGGSDYNLTFRIASAGYKLKHSGDYLILRRVHSASLTGRSSQKQKLSSRITTSAFLNNISRHVETFLRTEAKNVKPVSIQPTYSDIELKSFLPDEIFDFLIDVSADDDCLSKADISLYRPGESTRHFTLNSLVNNETTNSTDSISERCLRVPKTAQDNGLFDTESAVNLAASLTRLLDTHSGEAAYTVISSNKSGRSILKVIDAHLHLANSISVVKTNSERNEETVIVNAESTELASFLIMNMNSMFNSNRNASLSLQAEKTLAVKRLH